MNEKPEYKARHYYEDKRVAGDYDRVRFSGWMGKVIHETEEAALLRAVDRYFKAPGRLLDIPCGTGRLLPGLLKRGFEIEGGDIAESMLEIARDRFSGSSSITFNKVNAEALPYGDKAFDYLTSFRLMAHLPAGVRRKVLTEMLRVTRSCLIVNYHVEALSPLYLFNRIFRPLNCPAYPLSLKEMIEEIKSFPSVEICEIRKLSWYERSSTLAVIRKVS